VYPDRIQTAYAFDAACAEGTFLLGSLLVALIAAELSAATAMTVAAGIGIVGTVVFAGSWRSRSWRPEPSSVSTSAVGVGGVKTVIVHAVALGAGIGALEIAVPAFAEAHGALDRSGLLLALYSVGSVTGGLWLGSRQPATGVALVRRYQLLLAEGAVAAVLLPIGCAGHSGADPRRQRVLPGADRRHDVPAARTTRASRKSDGGVRVAQHRLLQRCGRGIGGRWCAGPRSRPDARDGTRGCGSGSCRAGGGGHTGDAPARGRSRVNRRYAADHQRAGHAAVMISGSPSVTSTVSS
jgi:hypothetical protein